MTLPSGSKKAAHCPKIFQANIRRFQRGKLILTKEILLDGLKKFKPGQVIWAEYYRQALGPCIYTLKKIVLFIST